MFPPVEFADEETGLLAIGGALDSATLYAAYSRGIFPWPIESSNENFWFAPSRRAVLFFEELHVSKRLRRSLKNSGFEYSHNHCFERVIKECAQYRGDPDNRSWITPAMQRAYTQLHREGLAHSIETWRGDELVGGLYGILHGAYFCGESMFHRADNASKGALLFLVELMKTRGGTFLDLQMISPHFEALGAREIPRNEFAELLGNAWNTFS